MYLITVVQVFQMSEPGGYVSSKLVFSLKCHSVLYFMIVVAIAEQTHLVAPSSFDKDIFLSLAAVEVTIFCVSFSFLFFLCQQWHCNCIIYYILLTAQDQRCSIRQEHLQPLWRHPQVRVEQACSDVLLGVKHTPIVWSLNDFPSFIPV